MSKAEEKNFDEASKQENELLLAYMEGKIENLNLLRQKLQDLRPGVDLKLEDVAQKLKPILDPPYS